MAIARPTPFRRTSSPTLAGGDLKYLLDALRRIETTLSDLCLLCPQEADAEPPRRWSGMQRLSRAPWRPLPGQTEDAWVYYDGLSDTWKPL